MFKKFKTPPPEEHLPRSYEWLALEDSAQPAAAVEEPTGPVGQVGAGHAVYEIADLAGLSPEQVEGLKQQAYDDIADGLVGCAHLVITRDLTTGIVHHHVPCSSGWEALLLAEQIVAEKLAEKPPRKSTVTITPLLPH